MFAVCHYSLWRLCLHSYPLASNYLTCLVVRHCQTDDSGFGAGARHDDHDDYHRNPDGFDPGHDHRHFGDFDPVACLAVPHP